MLNHAIQTAVRKRELETPVQKRILQALAALADEHGEVHQSLTEIAYRAQTCRRTVIEVLHELEALGEILILNQQRVKGHYRINHLPTEEKPPIDSLRTPIVDAIRLLPLPVRVSTIFQALAQYASRSGNNIFPSVWTLMRDTCYSKSVIQETLRWLLKTGFIAPDRDCVTPTYQTRIGYKIPGWHSLSQTLIIDEGQIAQIKALYDHHNRHYWQHKQVKSEGNQIHTDQAQQIQEEDDSTWLEEHAFDFDEYTPGRSTWPDEEECEEELAEDELPAEEEGKERIRAEAETGAEDPVAAPRAPQDEELEFEEVCHAPPPRPRFQPGAAPSERIRVLLAPQRRRNAEVSLKSYQAMLKMMEPHRKRIEEHESGRAVVDEATLEKGRAIVRFCQQTIDAYEEHCKQRE